MTSSSANIVLDSQKRPMEPETINVLLIEDDAGYAAVVQQLLRRFPGKRFMVTWIEDADRAVEELSKSPSFDIILMDHFLPKQTGLEIIKQLHGDQCRIPAIFLTSSKDFRLAVEAMKYGVEDYLVKGESMDSILPRTILSVLERVKLKNKIERAEKNKIIAQKSIEAIHELIVAICHEFNNPLAAVKISADIISRSKLNNSERELLERFTENLGHLEKEVQRLRDVHWETDDSYSAEEMRR